MGFRFALIAWLLSSFSLLSQTHLRGILVHDGQPVANVAVNTSFGTTISDSKGEFQLAIAGNKCRIIIVDEQYNSIDTTIQNFTKSIRIALTIRTGQLNEVEVRAKREQASLIRLEMIEGTAIYAGKKSEVIRVEDYPANTAQNNAREIFAKVTGMNVWEGDDSGLQLNIGGRGLNPNRASNFNVRQNGYDISPDALGYPESYYTPPADGVSEIRIVKGAASLQYGTQFGGLIDFIMKAPPRKDGWDIVQKVNAGSYGMFNNFTSVGYRKGKTGVYGFFQYRRGDGWRPNSAFHSYDGYIHVEHAINDIHTISFESSHLYYLSQQAGGLSDRMFNEDPGQSNRYRNWFAIHWNIAALQWNAKWGAADELNVKLYGLLAGRDALGFRNYRPEAEDPGTGNREYIDGDFKNAGLEARWLHRHTWFKNNGAFVVGARVYGANNYSYQGLGPDGNDADFRFIDHPENLSSEYNYPSLNSSLFTEHIIPITQRWTITPGIRLEYISSKAKGYYREIVKDLAGNIILNETHPSELDKPRTFAIAGLGTEYQFKGGYSFYGNISQNFRAITYSDIHVTNPSFRIDTNITDESGWSLDLGIRRKTHERFRFDIGVFLLNYNNRIGEILLQDNTTFQFISTRTNIGQALIYGIESFTDLTLLSESPRRPNVSWFTNLAILQSTYLRSELPNVEGNEVEFVPLLNVKSGLEGRFRNWRTKIQLTYLTKQYTDAANDENGGSAAVTGAIPAFMVWDFSLQYRWKNLTGECGVNNMLNEMYFTRRATGYPGPGIMPSPARSFYVGISVKI